MVLHWDWPSRLLHKWGLILSCAKATKATMLSSVAVVMDIGNTEAHPFHDADETHMPKCTVQHAHLLKVPDSLFKVFKSLMGRSLSQVGTSILGVQLRRRLCVLQGCLCIAQLQVGCRPTEHSQNCCHYLCSASKPPGCMMIDREATGCNSRGVFSIHQHLCQILLPVRD